MFRLRILLQIINLSPMDYLRGSALCLLIALISINDFPSCLNKFQFTLFADDRTLSLKIDPGPVYEVGPLINYELSSVATWLPANKFLINFDRRGRRGTRGHWGIVGQEDIGEL